MSDVSIHVSYHQDEDSPPRTEQQQDQSSSVDRSNVPGEEDASKAVDSEGTKPVDGMSTHQSAGEDTGEREQTSMAVEPPEPDTYDTTEQKGVVSSDEPPVENLVEQPQEKQLPTSNEEETTMVAENEDEP